MDTSQSLLPSARDFLVEAIVNHDAGKHSFAIVHAVTAAELVLKERLRRLHPTLMFEKIDVQYPQRGHTVGLARLPKRLVNLGVEIDQDENSHIKRFADWRNQIVHHLPEYDKNVAEKQLPQLLDFIASFLRRELETQLSEILPVALYATAEKLLGEWQPILAEARRRADNSGTVVAAACPRCGVTGVLSTQDEDIVNCELCGTQGFKHERCQQCGRDTVVAVTSSLEDHYCDDCIDAAGDLYIQQIIDMRRGK